MDVPLNPSEASVTNEVSETGESDTSRDPGIPPRREDIFGVPVSVTDYAQVVDFCLARAKAHQPACIDAANVHVVVSARQDERFLRALRDFEVVTPDGQPLRWVLNWFYGAGLTDRVYGPELMWRVCAKCAEEGVGIYLYGSTEQTIAALSDRLLKAFPDLKISGAESPPFRRLTDMETDRALARIHDSGARVLLLGLGCPRQELFAHEIRSRLRAVTLCVGAAFDFHAGVKPMAPGWMQKRGLEWLFRLSSEPKRLFKRYFVTNSIFAGLMMGAVIQRMLNHQPEQESARQRQPA